MVDSNLQQKGKKSDAGSARTEMVLMPFGSKNRASGGNSGK